VALLVFRLCRLLHTGPQDWRRYLVVLVLGAVGAVLVFPLLFQTIMFTIQGLARALSFPVTQQFGFWPTVSGTTLNLLGPILILYVGTVLGWHAVIFHSDLKERKLKAVELESLLHQARLETLRNQLHPHFLFNTLHSIAELVHENPALAEQLILRLAELLREVLKTTARQEVPLGDEIKFIRSYLEIEQMRLGDRLNVEWDVDQETLTASVPSLVLQPLVENAIKHGIAALARPGRLSIRARRDDGFLHLQVQDTGPGLPPETAGNDGGIGLANTKDRLQRLYGARQRFELVNDNGLIINVRIPFAPAAVAAVQSS
jgi:LytS/YehU family sensor histidine kinase